MRQLRNPQCRVVVFLSIVLIGAGIVGADCFADEPAAAREIVELAKSFSRHSSNPVFDVGRPGEWDDGRSGCFSLLKVGERFRLWYMGAGGKNPWRIGLATSMDGVRWERSSSNPVLSVGEAGKWDDRAVAMPHVLKDGDTYRMWYSGSGKGGGFGLATSADGQSWKRYGSAPVLQGIGGSLDPCVVKIGKQFVLWHCGEVGGKYRILRATSPDGIRWTKDAEPVLPLGNADDFDGRHHAGPDVIQVDDQFLMFYLGANKRWAVGLATSSDGVHWEKVAGGPVFDVGGPDDWDGGSLLHAEVLWLDGRFHLWYAAHNQADTNKPEHEQTIRIGYAVSDSIVERNSFRSCADEEIAEKTANAENGMNSVLPLAKSPLTAEQVRDIQQQWAKHLDRPLVQTNSIGMKLSLLPPGEFTMGRTEEQLDELLATVKNDPKTKRNYVGQVVWSMLMMPAHRVRLTKPFYVGTTEVTVGQFRQFADASGYKTEAEQGLNAGVPYKDRRPISTWRKPMAWRSDYKPTDDDPVMHLCWNDCVAFCKWLSAKEGQEYALPTEAEWEYACRAGTTTPWSFGDRADADRVAHEYAWWSEAPQGQHDKPRVVGLGKPNAFGLYDMHGNMWEYVADWWHRLSYKESPLNDPTGPAEQSEQQDLRRIIRGSSFDWDRWGGDSAYRMRITQRSNQHPHMSFRVELRLKGVEGVPPAVDLDEPRRQQKRDPGADSPEVVAALKAGATATPLEKELAVNLGNGVTMEFVLIPAGSFLMGSDKGLKDERPVHRVVISRPFYMAKYETTQSQWEAVLGKNERLTELASADNDMTGPRKAMNEMSWTQCQEFIATLKTKVSGHAFALPTEAQWEYACRAGSTAEFSFGDDASSLGDYAWFQGNMIWVGQPAFRGRGFYHDVGVKKPNAFGLYDMHGGVWEWCEDRYDPDYYFNAPLVDPRGPESGRFRVLRGGSWFRFAKYARSAYRREFHPDGDGDAVTAYIIDFGCRLVINLKP